MLKNFKDSKALKITKITLMNKLYFLTIFVVFSIPAIWAEEITQSMEGAMDIKITFPENAIVGRTIPITILVENKGWENKQDISLVFSSQDKAIIPITSKDFKIEKLSQGGSFGGNLDFQISENASPGIHFINIQYSQILVANNETPQPPINRDIAIPIRIIDEPDVIIYTKTPESIFANAEFPFEVEISSNDIEIKDVGVKISPPKDIEFRGETMHTFSKIERGESVVFTSRIITPEKEVNTEFKIPFEIIVEYTDDVGEKISDSKTISLVLRPRTFMELTTEGGIWIGDFFIAPYVSLGTIIGIPAGAIISLIIRKRSLHSNKKKTRTKN